MPLFVLLPDSSSCVSHSSPWTAAMVRASTCQKDWKSASPVHATWCTCAAEPMVC